MTRISSKTIKCILEEHALGHRNIDISKKHNLNRSIVSYYICKERRNVWNIKNKTKKKILKKVVKKSFIALSDIAFYLCIAFVLASCVISWRLHFGR